MAGPNRSVIGERLEHAVWVEEAVRLALKHWSARRIARKLGLHHSTVAEALAKELASHKVPAGQLEAYRNQQRETIFRLLAKWEPLALGNRKKGVAPDKDAAAVHLKYLERWAKLDGLDAPSRADINMAGLTNEQLATLVAPDDAGTAKADPESGSAGVGAQESDLGEDDAGRGAGEGEG